MAIPSIKKINRAHYDLTNPKASTKAKLEALDDLTVDPTSPKMIGEISPIKPIVTLKNSGGLLKPTSPPTDADINDAISINEDRSTATEEEKSYAKDVLKRAPPEQVKKLIKEFNSMEKVSQASGGRVGSPIHGSAQRGWGKAVKARR